MRIRRANCRQAFAGAPLLLRASLAALIAGASTHCVWKHAADLAHHAQAARANAAGEALPIGGQQHGCDNESGCICRGATLAVAVEACDQQTATGLVLADRLADDRGVLQPHLLADQSDGGDRLRAVPPPSGRKLRALIASLVI